MTRKRFKKLLMGGYVHTSNGTPAILERDFAEFIANAVNGSGQSYAEAMKEMSVIEVAEDES